jgi:hypothetical protein
MPDPARMLYQALAALEDKAVAARRKDGLPYSRRAAGAAAARAPYSVKIDGRRISSWVPADPAVAQVPRAGDADRVWALVRVWSDWAGDPAPRQRYWRDLIEAAQPATLRKPVAGSPASMSPARAARTAYLEQVRRIAPPALLGRNGELADLATFCVEPGRGPYAWWQAGPWAGKSALLSSFVLDPPPQLAEGGVQLVSFFITGRLAAQDTREAFTEAVLDQLARLTGQDLPSSLPEATREVYLLDLLARAAGACEEAGGRLVLVVDGLDEDRSMDTGRGAHSIAALLPAVPPAGMRVIVAGRPNPPIPDDVPGWHPLRDLAIIHPLHVSPHAQDMQRLSQRELQRLLRGPAVGQDVLGLLTVARGGLTASDLVELTGVLLWE